jgi:hypothetical protein
MSSAVRVEFGSMFPLGAFLVGEVRPKRDYERSRSEGVDIQEVVRDESGDPVRDASGEPVKVWTIEVDDAEMDRGFGRFKVTVHSVRQPVPPARVDDSPYRRIELVGLSAKPWIDSGWCRGERRRGEAHKCRARIAWTFTAEGIQAPGAKPAGEKVAAGNGRAGSG